MASFQQKPPARIKLRRDAIIHAIAFHDEMYAVGDDEALTVVDAATDHSIRRFEDMGTVLMGNFWDARAMLIGPRRPQCSC